MDPVSLRLEVLFPGLVGSSWHVTSPSSRRYNCIAWAAEDTTKWWDPVPEGYWPQGAPREFTLAAFTRVFGLLGYEACDGREIGVAPGFDKVAIFANRGRPTHAARQLPSGEWTSKIGALEDISHPLAALEGDEYGSCSVIMRRRQENDPNL